MSRDGAAPLVIGVASRPRPGEHVCGDVAVSAPRHAGALVAVLDGVGHGSEAAEAAAIGAEALRAPGSDSLPVLVQLCHQRLRGTRGVALSVALLDAAASRLTWLGVGNVCGVVVRPHAAGHAATEMLLLRSGLVGVQLPPLQPSQLRFGPGDTLLFATDGIRVDALQRAAEPGSPQAIAERILGHGSQSTDDALVLVARLAELPA